MFEDVQKLVDEYSDLEKRMSDPALHNDQREARKVGRRYAELGPVIAGYRNWQSVAGDLETAQTLAEEDASFAEEVPALQEQHDSLAEQLRDLLVPRDPDDARDIILEVKAGEGGDEAALFAGDLLRMYMRYAEKMGWKSEIIEGTESDLGGYKDVSVAIKRKGNAEGIDGVWAMLKFEGGVHRVQRVPVTESQGRIHTSAVGVMVFPEADDPEEVEIHPSDIRVDVYRSSGPGGQSVNTTDSAVRLTHLETGIVVSCQNEKSQLQNKESAMRILRARLLAVQAEAAEAEAQDARRSQVRTMDRSERIRTYNFPENRISDHRTGFKAYNLETVLDGEIGPVIESCLVADREARLANVGSQS